MPRTKTVIKNFTDEELETALEETKAERKKLFAEQSRVNKLLTTNYNKLEKLTAESTNRTIQSGEADWSYLLETDGGSNMVKYNELNRRLNEIGLRQSGYHPETQQYCIQLILYKYADDAEERLKKTIDGFMEVLPYLKPDPKTNEIHVDVLESTLSQFGVYDFFFKKEDGEYFGQIRFTYSNDTEWLPIDDFWAEAVAQCPYDRPEEDEDDEW